MRQLAGGLAAVGVTFLALYTCGCCCSQPDDTVDRLSPSSFNRRLYQLKSQWEALENESQWLAQQDQELALEWRTYRDLEFKFTSSLNDEQLDALGERLSVDFAPTPDSPAQVEADSRISDVLPLEKSKELDVLLGIRSDLMARSAELEERRQLYNQLVLQHKSRIRAELAAIEQQRHPDVQRIPRRTGGGRGGMGRARNRKKER